jgi:hypothetical protein
MADYLKSTNFATKDALPSGNAGKIVKGTEIDTEFNAIADAVESKADLLNPVFSGLLTTDTLATTGAANIGGTLAVSSDFSAAADAQFTGTGRILFPKGTTAQRPSAPTSGSVRYNTDLGYLENYTGTEWRVVGYVTPADVSDKANTSTGYFQLPRGTIAQRPVSPTEGLIRYNAESDIYEGYVNSSWHKFLTVDQGSYSINYVAVGGGAGGGPVDVRNGSGGGGAGKVTASTTSVTPGASVLTITIGAGGATNSSGSASGITGIVSSGSGSTGTLNGGSSGNGYAGGTGVLEFYGLGNGGGGGGAGGVGGNASAYAGEGGGGPGGDGGVGLETLITGTSQYFGGGGGGAGTGTANGGSGGTGGGGRGGGHWGASTAGSPNTGGGGGGWQANAGSSGGSGVVFLSMPTLNYTGTHTGSPTITTTGSYTVLKYTGSGTYTC